MTKKKIRSDLRVEFLTVRLTTSDIERLERLRSLVNPYGNKESKAKAISAALFLAEKHLKK